VTPEDATSDRPVDVLDSVIKSQERNTVYDFEWYPGMNSSDPTTCCWLTTRERAPVQMWDAFDGTLRCTYRGYDSVDELEPALSVCFSTDGSYIYAGYKKRLRTFHTERYR
jgi:telomerase Cajal body protein 1